MMFILFGVKWLFIIIAHYRTTPYLCDVTYKHDRMRIEHIAIWADDIERLRDFYRKYFRMTWRPICESGQEIHLLLPVLRGG